VQELAKGQRLIATEATMIRYSPSRHT
jgi:hypothetical protein